WWASHVAPWSRSSASGRAPRAIAPSHSSRTRIPAPSPSVRPRLRASNGRQPAGSMRRRAPNPAYVRRQSGSPPPAIIRGARPWGIVWAGAATAPADEEQAVVFVSLGPRRPNRRAIASVDAAEGSLKAGAAVIGGFDPRAAATRPSYHDSASSIPPFALP